MDRSSTLTTMVSSNNDPSQRNHQDQEKKRNHISFLARHKDDLPSHRRQQAHKKTRSLSSSPGPEVKRKISSQSRYDDATPSTSVVLRKAIRGFLPSIPSRRAWVEWTTTIPLVAALLAPLSTLMDIPALSQKWYTLNSVPVPDPTPCLVLSAVGLFLNFLANLLLIVRFSASSRAYWAPATRLSTLCWTAKTIIAIVNLAVYGAGSRNEVGYVYSEGFFCAIVSVVLAGFISIILVVHYFCAFDREDNKGGVRNVRMQGRHFMLSISFLLGVIAIQALIYSKIEGWDYFEGIYFSIVTMLTVGFGDLHPTYLATKILLLPFAIVTISQLANEVSIIVDYFADRAQTRRETWRAKWERAVKQQARQRNPNASLKEEITLIDDIAAQEELMSQLYDLFWSLGSLIAFWAVGAACFHAIEPDNFTTFWVALYFEIEFSLTIGYGDYYPSTSGGRVFWVVYSLAAVPLIASFAVQTVTGLLSTFASQGEKNQRERRAELQQSDAFQDHRGFILQHYDTLSKMMGGVPDIGDLRSAKGDTDNGDMSVESARAAETKEEVLDEQKDSRHPDADRDTDLDGRTDSASSPVHEKDGDVGSKNRREDRRSGADGEGPNGGDEEDDSGRYGDARHGDDQKLITDLIESAVRMEAIARRLLIDTLPRDSLGRTILKADFEIQYRDVKDLGGDAEGLANLWHHESDRANQEKGPTDVHPDSGSTCDQIRRYRETFARVLVIGSELQKLEGKQRYRFERRRGEETADQIADGADKQEKDDERMGKLKRMTTFQKMKERRRLMKLMVTSDVSDPAMADDPV